MTRRPRFNRPGQGGGWQSVRDWLNVIAAAGTLLIGIGTLWVTARVSGLEDYFQSEISTRNSQLSSLLEQSEAAAKDLQVREQQLTNLRTRTDEAIGVAVETQGALATSTAHLLVVQEEMRAERGNLADARSQLVTLESLTAAQQHALALLFAREVHDWAMQVTGGLVRINRATWGAPRAEVRTPIGQIVWDELVARGSVKANDPQAGPFYRRLLSRLPQVCPTFREREIVSAAIPPLPSYDAGPYPRGLSETQIGAQAQHRMDEATRNIMARHDQTEQNINAHNAATLGFMEYAYDCICDATVSDTADVADVCAQSR